MYPEDPVYIAVIAFRLICSCILIFALYHVLLGQRNETQLDNIPGPWLSVPLLGYLPFLGLRVHLSLNRLQRKYGDIYAISIGSQRVVIISGLDTIKAALVEQSIVFSGRPALYTFQIASTGKSMVFNSFSEQWKSHRGLTERALKLFCRMPAEEPLGENNKQNRLEEIVCKEAQNLVSSFLEKSSEGNKGIDPVQDILWSAAHVKYTLCMGNSHTEREDFVKMVKATLALIQSHNRGNAINFFPWAKFLFYGLYRHTHNVCSTMQCLTQRKEEEHLASYNKDECRDVLDALIRLGVRRASCNLEQDRALHTVQEYLAAGLDIMYVAITWAVLYLAEYPDIQKKIQQEVDDTLGRSDMPCTYHIKMMPYTYSFVLETLRHSGVVPYTLPHSTLADTTLNGIFIPKDSFVLINLYSVSRDPKLWPDPEKFRPERFLQEDSAAVAQVKEGYYPFGLGRRRCVGEEISRTEIFLYVTMLLQACSIHKVPEVKSYDLQPQFGVILRPKPFKVIFKER